MLTYAPAATAATATRAEAAAPTARTLNLNGHLQQASGQQRPQVVEQQQNSSKAAVKQQ
jgi:hypothetical protein